MHALCTPRHIKGPLCSQIPCIGVQILPTVPEDKFLISQLDIFNLIDHRKLTYRQVDRETILNERTSYSVRSLILGMLVLRAFSRIKICRNSDFKHVWHAIIDKIIQTLFALKSNQKTTSGVFSDAFRRDEQHFARFLREGTALNF